MRELEEGEEENEIETEGKNQSLFLDCTKHIHGDGIGLHMSTRLSSYPKSLSNPKKISALKETIERKG